MLSAGTAISQCPPGPRRTGLRRSESRVGVSKYSRSSCTVGLDSGFSEQDRIALAFVLSPQPAAAHRELHGVGPS